MISFLEHWKFPCVLSFFGLAFHQTPCCGTSSPIPFSFCSVLAGLNLMSLVSHCEPWLIKTWGSVRLLRMMRAVSLHTAENRMTASAVAACMAPLLLRPLLAGECGLEDDSEVSADNATQLLAATTAANNAQAIVTTLLEDYDSLFEVSHYMLYTSLVNMQKWVRCWEVW